MSKNPISIIQAIENNYKDKENQFMHVINEMEQIAQEKLQECEKEENKQGEQVMRALCQTISSIGKAYIAIYDLKPNQKTNQA